MKSVAVWVLVGVCFLGTAFANPLAEEAKYIRETYNSYAMTEDLHAALAGIPRLLQEQHSLQERGFDLEPEQQEQLAQYRQTAKGVKMVLIGFPECGPCHALFNLLDSEKGSQCWLEYWEAKGVEFFMVNSRQEQQYGYNPNNLLGVWGVSSVPTLLLIQDGLPRVRLNGYNPGQAREVLRVLEKEIDHLQATSSH